MPAPGAVLNRGTDEHDSIPYLYSTKLLGNSLLCATALVNFHSSQGRVADAGVEHRLQASLIFRRACLPRRIAALSSAPNPMLRSGTWIVVNF